MEQFNELVERYLAAWNERDAARRRELIARIWTEDAAYRDPLMAGSGYAELDALIQGVQERFAGFSFRGVGQADGYGDVVRFSWELGPPQGPAPVAGSDVALLAPDGRFTRVIGFLDRVPAAPGA